jgi:hypothetical protein
VTVHASGTLVTAEEPRVGDFLFDSFIQMRMPVVNGGSRGPNHRQWLERFRGEWFKNFLPRERAGGVHTETPTSNKKSGTREPSFDSDKQATDVVAVRISRSWWTSSMPLYPICLEPVWKPKRRQ